MSHVEHTEQVEIHGGVVVGDDGSESSRAAVMWAAQDAARRGATLHLLRAWSITTAPRPASWKEGYVPPLPDFEAAVLKDLSTRAAQLLGATQGVSVELHAVHAPAARALIRASAGADVVVVGTRGRGGFAELLMGSVAEQVARYAHCPVTVVRPSAPPHHSSP